MLHNMEYSFNRYLRSKLRAIKERGIIDIQQGNAVLSAAIDLREHTRQLCHLCRYSVRL